MVCNKRVSDEDVVKSYKKTRNIWESAKELGICGQSVWERLKKLNIKECTNNKLSDEDKKKIIDFYKKGFETGDGQLEKFCKEIKRTKQFVCRYAKMEGLTSMKRICCQQLKEGMSKRSKDMIKNYGHPRGMTGKHHSEETKKNLSKKHVEFCSKKENREKVLMWIKKGLKTKIKKYGSLTTNTREGCSWKAGWREIGGKRKYFRSRWEANYARYLEWLKKYKQIKDWQHESKTFWFDKIKRGCCSYLPDFEVENNDGTKEYHEVKGWYDKRSQTKTKRMAKYYPDVKLVIIFQKQYNEIKKKVSNLIPDWE